MGEREFRIELRTRLQAICRPSTAKIPLYLRKIPKYLRKIPRYLRPTPARPVAARRRADGAVARSCRATRRSSGPNVLEARCHESSIQMFILSSPHPPLHESVEAVAWHSLCCAPPSSRTSSLRCVRGEKNPLPPPIASCAASRMLSVLLCCGPAGSLALRRCLLWRTMWSRRKERPSSRLRCTDSAPRAVGGSRLSLSGTRMGQRPVPVPP